MSTPTRPSPGQAAGVPDPGPATSARTPTRIFLVLFVALVLAVGTSESTNADSLRDAPRASGFAPALIVNPTIDHPDPSILWDPVARLYRMYATNSWDGGPVPEFVSDKVTGHWTNAGNVLLSLPSWVGAGLKTWAPEVADINGVWTLWGSTSDGTVTPGQVKVCLYRATAPSPAGPFVVDPVRPRCDFPLGGDIDPTPVEFGNQWWLVEKADANSVNLPTVFISQRIGPDGELTGPRYAILTADLPWEDGLIEAPNFVESPYHQWWLIFSGGNFYPSEPTYRIAAIPCAGPEGGCNEFGLTLLVGGNQQGASPGEQESFVDKSGQWWLAYNPGGPLSPSRPLALVKLNFDVRGIPYVSTP